MPRKLKGEFGSAHEVKNVRDMGWLGTKNGDLLKLLIENKFDIFVTVDKNLSYEQNLENLPLSIFLLLAVNNRLETLEKLVTKILEIIAKGNLQKLHKIFLNYRLHLPLSLLVLLIDKNYIYPCGNTQQLYE